MNVNAEPFVPGARPASRAQPAALAAARAAATASPVLPLSPTRKDSTSGTAQIIPFAKRPDCMFFVKVCSHPLSPSSTTPPFACSHRVVPFLHNTHGDGAGNAAGDVHKG